MAITIYQNVHMHETKISVYIPAGGEGGSKFLGGSASLNPTLVVPMRQEREAEEAARICSSGEHD